MVNRLFPTRLKQLRKEKNLTQQQLSDMLKISRNTYAQYETGRREPDFSTAQLIANFFDVTVDNLIGSDDVGSATTKEDKKPKDLKRILEQHDILFDGVPIDEDAKKEIMHIVEFELYKKAKELNKRKKTTPDS